MTSSASSSSFLILSRQKSLTRRDTVHRRVSTSFDQSTLDLEDQVFSPPPKLDESIGLFLKFNFRTKEIISFKAFTWFR